MSTLYDLFKVNENASQEEIKKAFERIIKELSILQQDDETINRVRRLKIAYSILSNPEKRKKYDLDLAEKRADDLIKNVEIKKNEDVELHDNSIKQQSKIDMEEKVSNKIKKEENDFSKNIAKENAKKSQKTGEKYKTKLESNKTELSKRLKIQEKEEKRKLKEQKKQYIKEMRQKREMEVQAYGQYLEQQGYKVKYPWTLSRVKRLLISVLFICISLIIIWNIPFVNVYLKNLYNDNIVIQKIVDTFINIFEIVLIK